MKKSEATTKTCPFMSIPLLGDTEEYRSGCIHQVKCITNECMAWEETTFDRVSPSANKDAEKTGYCKRIGK